MKELFLTEDLHQNYLALKRYYSGNTVKRSRHRRSGRKYREFKVKALEAQDWRCKDCSRPFYGVSEATADHVIPRRYGSTYAMNHEYVCHDCNHDREQRRDAVLESFFGSLVDFA